jgi:alpha-amylase
VNQINQVKSTCSDSTILGSFSENHDNPRFANYTADMSLAKNVIAFTMLADGIPIIYAGQEQHYSGGNDPNNREALWLSGYNTASPLYRHVAQLNRVRGRAIRQSPTYLTYKNTPIYSDATTLAMRKGPDGFQLVTVLSNLGSNGGKYVLSLGATGYRPGEQLVEVLSCAPVTVDDAGNIPIQMDQGLARVFYPRGQLRGSGICDL